MDGLLIDSEPLWNEAADEVFKSYHLNLTEEQYKTTTGLRTKEFVQWWFRQYNLGDEALEEAEKNIVDLVLKKVSERGKIMPGVKYIFDFFAQKGFKIGLATSSPNELIELVVEITQIKSYLQAVASAEHLPFGKPHPQVYLNCASELGSNPYECICFEDSFNGMIAAKAARMRCVVVPHQSQLKDERWGAADLKISSLQNFGNLHLDLIQSK